MSGNKIMFDTMVSTMMLCNDETLSMYEAEFGIIKSADYMLKDGMLTIIANGKTWMFQSESMMEIKLSGVYTLQIYDGEDNTNTGITLAFDNNNLSAKICNNLSTNYIASSTMLTFDTIASTRMLCNNDILAMMESNFIAMKNAEYTTMNDNTLTITANSHTRVWMK